MTILSIETSTSVCSAAISIDGAVMEQCIHEEGSNHAKLLPLYIDQLLNSAREKGVQIDAVALSEGPGSYTGLRIGSSTAKGLCYGLSIPLIPVPTLAILEAAAKAKSAEPGIYIPMIDARRMEVYTTATDAKARAVVVESEQSLIETEEEVYYFGDGAAKCTEVLAKPNWHYLPDIVPQAQYMGGLAEQINTRLTGTELAYYEPYYLKEFIAAQSHVKGLL